MAFFTSLTFLQLVRSYGLKQEFFTPHCPQQNGIVERVIRTLKDQRIHRHRFESLQHATRTIEDWIQFYNHRRPHQSARYDNTNVSLPISSLTCTETDGLIQFSKHMKHSKKTMLNSFDRLISLFRMCFKTRNNDHQSPAREASDLPN